MKQGVGWRLKYRNYPSIKFYINLQYGHKKNIFLDIDLAFKDGIILVWNHDLIKIISATDMSNLTKMDWIEIKLNIGIILALIMEYLMIKVEYNFLYQKYP